MRVRVNGQDLDLPEATDVAALVKAYLNGSLTSFEVERRVERSGDSNEDSNTARGRGDEDVARRGGIAVAVNSELVPRSTWRSVRLREGDRVEIVGASQGG